MATWWWSVDISKPVISVRNLVTWGNIGSNFLAAARLLYYMIFTIDLQLFIFPPFFFSFFPPLLSGPYLWNRYSQRLQIKCAAWSCCLILHHSLPSNSLCYFFIFFIFFFFSGKILSRPYLWNRWSQRLQIECAAWSYGLILHYSLPSNSLRYFFKFFKFFFIFFRHDFVRAISLEPLLTETPN